MQSFRRFIAITFAVLTFAVYGFAQTASIQGTVTDPTGAVVQGAEIVTKNMETGLTREATSTGTGAFSFTNLPVGTYEITAKKSSFKTYHASNVQLTVAQTLGVNIQMAPGAVTEEVQVRGDQLPPVDLETSQVSNLVNEREIKDLPLITRDPYSLVLLSPGTSQTNSRLGGFTVNGSRERNNNFMLDGVDNNDTSVPGIAGGVLSANPDSTEEFRVITNNFNAEYGRNTGAIIEAVTKSGTNSFHGTAYWFGRWNGFGGARDWFNPGTGPNVRKQDPYVRNQFGYSFGGPIYKNKTFFFVNEEFDRFRTTLSNFVTAPTAGFRNGVFNYQYTDSSGNAQTVPIDISATGVNNGLGGAPLDPTMQKVFALYPVPTTSADGIAGTVFFPSTSATNSYAPVVKLDHHFTDHHAISLRYGYNHSFDPNPFHVDILPGNVGGVSSKAINQGLSANLTSTLKNNLINNFVVGWNRILLNFGCTGLSTLDSVSPLDAFGNGRDYNMDPFTSIGCTSLVSDGQWRKTGTTSYGDSLSWVHGNHTLKFGGDFRNIAEQGPDSFFSRRQLGMNAGFANIGSLLQGLPPICEFLANPNTPGCNPLGNAFGIEDSAYAFYGLVWNDFAGEFFDKNGARKGTDNKLFRQHEYDWFGQDTWKVRPNLTLTLGFRYQLDGVPFEEKGNLSNLLGDPGSFAQGQNVVMSIVGPGTGNQLYKTDYSNYEPRIGFSWDPWKDGKTAVRGGFGIFHDRVFGNLFGNARGNPPFEQDYQTFPIETINDFFGSGAFPAIVPNTTPSAIIPDGSTLGPVLFDTHFRNSASNNWNFGVQRELPGNNTIDLSYIGAKGTHIFRAVDGNPPDPALVSQLLTICDGVTTFLNAFGQTKTCTPSQVASGNLYFGFDAGRLPFNAVANNALFQPAYNRSVASSIYHSLQLKVTHRLSHGLQVQGSYTWAHAIDDSADPIDPAQNNRTFPRNSRNLAQDRGNSDNDIRQVAVINYIWEMPFGRGKGFLNSGFVGKVFEGWQLSGITSAQTGHPFEVRCSRDSQRTGISAWCDLVGNPFAAPSSPVDAQGNKVYFSNRNAFATPNFGGPGNIGRNQFYGPGYVNFDMEFSKRTKIGEKANLEFKFECYNIFNHPHFQQPDNLFADSTFGQISQTAGRPDATTSARQMQVALKLSF